MGIKDLFTSFSALSEFGNLSRSILPIMTDKDVSIIEKRKTLCQLVDNLSEKAFNNKIVLGQIFKIINMKEEICKEYVDTESQVNGILEWCPRLKEHKKELSKEVEKARKSCGMKI
jgi:hypothetical protein